MRLRTPSVSLPWFRDDYSALTPGGGLLVPRRYEGAVFEIVSDDETTVLASVTVDAEMRDMEATCTRFSIEGGTEPITADLLKVLDPVWFASWLLSRGGMAEKEGEPGVFQPDASKAWQTLASAGRRRTVTPRRLTEVAEAYRRGGAKAVSQDLYLSKSQAFRLIARAREDGYLTSETNEIEATA